MEIKALEFQKQGCWFSVIFLFFHYFWPDLFSVDPFSVFSPNCSVCMLIFSIFSYFIFLFLNFLSLFVFIFCETARTRRFSVIFAKVQWHPCKRCLRAWILMSLTLSDLTIRKQHSLLYCRHSCSTLPRTAHPRSWTAAAGGTNFNGSLFSNYGINLHHSFYDRKTIKQPVRLLWRAKGAKRRLLARLRFPRSVSVSVSQPLSVLETECNC